MRIKDILFFLFLTFQLNYNWQNQNNISIEKNKINIYGKFNGRTYENILLNNKTDITLYEKPETENGNPSLFQQTKSLIPYQDGINVSIKQIQYVTPIFKDLPKKLPIELSYNKQRWHEVKITFSNDDIKNYLLPASNRITMTDDVLGLYSSIDISALTHEGIKIEGIKEKKIPQNDSNDINVHKNEKKQ